MKMKSIISLLFIMMISILYFFGFCEWDLPIYLLCVGVTLVFMCIFIKQEKMYKDLREKEASFHKEMDRNNM